MEADGTRTILRHVYSHPDGRPATTEEVVLENGELADFTVDFPETDECGCRLERKGETLKFSFTRSDKNRTEQNRRK